MGFYHKYFLRDDPSLCSRIRYESSCRFKSSLGPTLKHNQLLNIITKESTGKETGRRQGQETFSELSEETLIGSKNNTIRNDNLVREKSEELESLSNRATYPASSVPLTVDNVKYISLLRFHDLKQKYDKSIEREILLRANYMSELNELEKDYKARMSFSLTKFTI